VRAAFDLSYRRLDPDTARLFGLLAVAPGPDVGLGVAAALADHPELSRALACASCAGRTCSTSSPPHPSRGRGGVCTT
jgi:hypothetical protein